MGRTLRSSPRCWREISHRLSPRTASLRSWPARSCRSSAHAGGARVYCGAAMRDRADRCDYLLAGALSLLTVLSRLPYRARMLYNWDAVQFALALREYDVVKHQPHPPGYILYVGLGRIVNAWLHDPTAAYVLLAVACSGLTTFVVYLLARGIYDRATALAAASVLAVSPLFWFYGSVGLTYAGEALFASIVAYFAFRALEGSEAGAWLPAAYLALPAGMPPSLLLLLPPMGLPRPAPRGGPPPRGARAAAPPRARPARLVAAA